MIKQRVYEAEPIHERHYADGYPLCWPQDRDGEFKGTYDQNEVTCKDCLKIIKEA